MDELLIRIVLFTICNVSFESLLLSHLHIYTFMKAY